MTVAMVNDLTQLFLEQRKTGCLSTPFSLTEFRDAVGKALAA